MQNKSVILSKKSKNRLLQSFTVIELLVVIAIIGLLASITLVALGPAQKRARDARRLTDIRQIHLAMELCYDDAACQGPEQYIDTAAEANFVANIGVNCTPSLLCPVPHDRLDVDPHQYKWTDGTTALYCVYAKLEAEANTYVCGSNKGVQKTAYAVGKVPDNENCCGLSLSGCSCTWASAGSGDCNPACNPGGPTPQCCRATCVPANTTQCPKHATTRCLAAGCQ